MPDTLVIRLATHDGLPLHRLVSSTGAELPVELRSTETGDTVAVQPDGELRTYETVAALAVAYGLRLGDLELAILAALAAEP